MYVNGVIYAGWISVKITRSIKAVAGSFELSIANNWASEKKGWIISPLDETVIKIDGKTVITGFVDKISSSFTANSRQITVSGRDKTADLVDCSYTGPSSLDGITLNTFISTVIAPFKLKFISEVLLGKETSDFKSQQGETAFAFLDRALKLRGFLLSSNYNGELVISKIGTKRATSSIMEGVNAIDPSFDFDAVDRFSHYIVKGQQTGSVEVEAEQSTQVTAQFVDENVKRYRPLIIMAEGSIDTKGALERARWEAMVRSAKSSVLKTTVRGWKQQDGSLWEANEIINFQSEYFGFGLDLLATEVSWTQSSSEGTVTEITLERKESYIPAAEKTKGSARDIWKELNP